MENSNETMNYSVVMQINEAIYSTMSDFDFQIIETITIAKFRIFEDAKKFIETCKPQFDGENGISYELFYINSDGEICPPKENKNEWYEICIFEKNCERVDVPIYIF